MTPEELQALKEAVAAHDPDDHNCTEWGDGQGPEAAYLLMRHASALIQAAEEVASLKAENEKLRAFAEHCLGYDLADIRSRASEALATLPQEGKKA